MDLEKFFEPAGIESDDLPADSFYKQVNTENFDVDECDIVLIGVGESRGSTNNKGCSEGPDSVRTQLAKLKKHKDDIRISDLGNLKPGHTLNDTYVAIGDILSYLISAELTVIVLGGSHDLTFGQYKAYEQMQKVINISSVDASFDLGKPKDDIGSESYLGKIILQQPNYLFNYSHLAYQTYMVGQSAVELMQKLNFDMYRLGEIRSDIREAEPVIRNADMLTFDLSAVRHSDAPGKDNTSPNGLTAEEYCQLSFYGGSSSKVSSIGFYETNPLLDNRSQSVALTAQAVWYFMEGWCKRRSDEPLINKSEFFKYHVQVDDSRHQITFFKSKLTDRWWMEVPFHENKAKYQRHCLLPCSITDYKQALENEVPERWWQAYQKLS